MPVEYVISDVCLWQISKNKARFYVGSRRGVGETADTVDGAVCEIMPAPGPGDSWRVARVIAVCVRHTEAGAGHQQNKPYAAYIKVNFSKTQTQVER